MNTYIRAAGKKKEKERTGERGKKEKDKVLIYNLRGNTQPVQTLFFLIFTYLII